MGKNHCGSIFLMASTLSVYLAGVVMNRIQSRFDAVRKTLPKEERKLRKAQVKRRKRAVLILALVFNFGLLVFLKYFNFLGGTVNGLLDRSRNSLHMQRFSSVRATRQGQ